MNSHNNALKHLCRHDVLASAVGLGFGNVVETKTFVRYTQMFVFIGMISVIIAAGLCVFFPILRSIDKNADFIMLQFVGLPMPVRKGLFQQAARRLKLLRRDYADEDDEFDDDEDDVDDVPMPTSDAENMGNNRNGVGSKLHSA